METKSNSGKLIDNLLGTLRSCASFFYVFIVFLGESTLGSLESTTGLFIVVVNSCKLFPTQERQPKPTYSIGPKRDNKGVF